MVDLEKQKEKNSSTGLTILSYGSLCASFIVLYYLFMQEAVSEYRDSDNWVKIPCTIVSSEVKIQPGFFKKPELNIVYTYQFRNAKFNSNRYCFAVLPGWQNGDTIEFKQLVNKNPPGKKTNCFVNPNNPNAAVLEPKIEFSLFAILVLLVSDLIVMRFLLSTFKFLFIRKKNTKKTNLEQPPANKKSGKKLDLLKKHHAKIAITIEEPHPKNIFERDLKNIFKKDKFPLTHYKRPLPTGPTTLKTTRLFPWNLLETIGTLLFTALPLSAILIEAISAIALAINFNLDWLIVTIYTIACLLIIIAAVILILFFYNSYRLKSTFTIEEAVIPLGESVQLLWQINSNVKQFKKLTIQLNAKITATYIAGSNTERFTALFLEKTLFETNRPNEMTSGEIEITIPKNSMHSWKATNNEIAWNLTITANTTSWTTSIQQYNITVTP